MPTNPRATADSLRRNLGLGASADRQHLSTLARGFATKNGNQGLYLGEAGEFRYSALKSAGFGQAIKANFAGLDTTDQLIINTLAGSFTPGAATGNYNVITMPGGTRLGYYVLGAGQTLLPAIVANGLDIGGDQVADEGFEIVTHMLGAQGVPFVIGLDPGFYLKVKLKIADVSGTDELLVGFRRAENVAAAYTSYLDYAALGWNTSANPALLKQLTGNDDTDVATSLTNTVADARAITFEVKVSATGAVTFRHDAVTAGTLAAPTGAVAFSFDNGDPVVPFIRMVNHTDIAGEVAIQELEVGYID
jgi:hypothetical protein